MAKGKRTLTLKVRLPPYCHPRNAWRKEIHKAVVKGQKETNVHFCDGDRLELLVRLYFDKVKLSFHDLDNRLKDVMDALQGRAGGSKKKPVLKPIIPNDSQVYRATIEKRLTPKSHRRHGGHLAIFRLKERR